MGRSSFDVDYRLDASFRALIEALSRAPSGFRHPSGVTTALEAKLYTCYRHTMYTEYAQVR